jgi:hypothetical protein
MDFPKFDGENPSNWLYKANQYFNIYQTQDNDKISMAYFHLEGKALIWFQDAEGTGQVNTWDSFYKSIYCSLFKANFWLLCLKRQFNQNGLKCHFSASPF